VHLQLSSHRACACLHRSSPFDRTGQKYMLLHAFFFVFLHILFAPATVPMLPPPYYTRTSFLEFLEKKGPAGMCPARHHSRCQPTALTFQRQYSIHHMNLALGRAVRPSPLVPGLWTETDWTANRCTVPVIRPAGGPPLSKSCV
jgi:hypothetical protein